MNNLLKSLSQITKVKLKGVADSLFIFTFFFGLLTMTSSFLKTNTVVVYTFLILTALIFLCAIFIVLYFAIKNPNYLRSETYQIRHEAMEILGDNERMLNNNLKDIHHIANPYPGKTDRKKTETEE